MGARRCRYAPQTPPRRATNTGQASVSAPNRAPVAELSQSVAALEPLLDAAAEPNALPADPVGAAAAKSGNKPGNKPTDKARVATAKKRVVRAEHHRRDPSSYIQYGASGAVGQVARPASSHSAIGSEPQPHPRRPQGSSGILTCTRPPHSATSMASTSIRWGAKRIRIACPSTGSRPRSATAKARRSRSQGREVVAECLQELRGSRDASA